MTGFQQILIFSVGIIAGLAVVSWGLGLLNFPANLPAEIYNGIDMIFELIYTFDFIIPSTTLMKIFLWVLTIEFVVATMTAGIWLYRLIFGLKK